MKNLIPYKVTNENFKFYNTTQKVYFIGVFGHLGALGSMVYFEIWELVIFNLIYSIPSFILALFLNRINKVNHAFAIAFFELYFHQVYGAYLLGWNFGFQYWLVYLAGVCFFNPTWKNFVQIILLTMISFTFLAMYLFFYEGKYSFPPSYGTVMYLFNSISTLVLLSLLINTYSKSAHKAEENLKKANIELQELHKQARSLLLNILPVSIADRLGKGERLIADSINNASIIFCDLVGFTKFSSNKTAHEIVEMLNGLFYLFDTVVEEMKLEKIKTIGDGYMVASGIPEQREDHAKKAVECALKMFAVLDNYNKELKTEFNLRIGISSGSVVAGVIGKNKFTYDIWGDPVNTASRMESHGTPGKVHISHFTYEEIKNYFKTTHRGSIEIKGKGAMDTYFIDEII